MNKKEEVIKAAKDLFTTYGYQKVSMDEIAKRSNVTKKTIYTYFKDKNDLIRYFLYDEINNMKKITQKIEKENIPFSEKIHNIIIELIDYRTSSKLLNAFSNNLNENSNQAKNLKECKEIINKAIYKELEEKITEAQKQKLIKPCDPEITAFIIYNSYVSLMFEWTKPINKEKVSLHLKEILKSGLFNN